jgi:hypothetical protein
MQIVAAIITSIFFIIAVSSQDAGELMSAWPVKLYPPVESTYSTSPSHSQIVNPVIKINEGTIEFTSSEFEYYLLKALDVIITFACVIYITLLLREIFRTLSNNHPFTSENAQRLRTIAILIILVVPYKILRSVFYYSYIKSNLTLKGGEWIDWWGFFGLDVKGNVLLTIDIDVSALVLGVLLLLTTEIFRIGTALQEDKDSII